VVDEEFGRLVRRVQEDIDRIIEAEGEPRSEEEALRILARAWRKYGYRVVDARKGNKEVEV